MDVVFCGAVWATVDEKDKNQSDEEHTPPIEVGNLLAMFQKIFDDPKGLPTRKEGGEDFLWRRFKWPCGQGQSWF